MADKVKILYNGSDAFAPQPTPFVALDDSVIYADEIWGRAESISLIGQITGCSFQSIVSAQNSILNSFNKSYQTLEVWQQEGAVSGLVFQKELVEIQSIDFSQERMFGVLPYTINLRCYPSGLFSGAYGILNPEDTWSFKEEENATLTATHTISCRPFNTSSGPSNALTNAKNWVFGRTGLGAVPVPIIISGVSDSRFCLLTQQENIDRFNGNYSIVETYTNDLARSGYGVIRYQTTIQSGDNLITVDLKGSAEGCGRNLTGIRAAFNNLDKTAIALKQYQYAFNRTDLNPIPTAQSFNEDPFTTKIDFSYSYDNSNLPSVWFDYTVDLSVGTNGFIAANIAGIVKARGGDVQNKLARCRAYASGVNLYSLVLPFYQNFDTSSLTPLNPVPVSNGQSNNETDGTVGLNAAFTNQIQVDSIFDSFTYEITVVPSIGQVDAKPIVNGRGTWSVVNLGYGSRATVTVNGNAVVNRNYAAAQGESAIRQKAFQLFNQYGIGSNAALEQNLVTMNRTDDRVMSFSFVWGCGPANIVGPTSVGSMLLH